MPQAKPKADAAAKGDKSAEDHRKPYKVIAENHTHNGKPAPVGSTIYLGKGQAALLLTRKVVREVST